MSGTDAHKRCSKCGVEKPRTEFARDCHRADGLQWHCKPCGREYRVANKKHAAEYHRAYQLRRKYDITPAEFDAMLAAQDGRCAICATDTPGGRHNNFHVDHCHAAGRVRGLLCPTCNTALGHYEKMLANPRVHEYLCQ